MEILNEKGSDQFTPSKKFYLSIASLASLALTAALSSTSLSIALATIANEIHLSTTQAFWLSISSSLASTVFQPSCASLSDNLGRKPVLAVSAACLAAGLMMAALAQNFIVLIVARTLLGIGIGCVTAMSEIIVTDIVPLRFRGQYLAYVSIAWAVGTVSGPIVGGSLAKHSSWRWIFGLNVPLCVVSLVMSLVTLPPSISPRVSIATGLRRVDWIGLLLFTTSLLGMLIPVMQARVIYAWDDIHTILPLGLSSVGMLLFCLYEYFLASNPLIPLVIFKNRTAVLTYLSTIIHGVVLWCLLCYLPLYYEAVKNMSPIDSGIAVLPETLTLVPASVITGLLITKTGTYRWAIWIGWVVTTIGMGLLMLLDVNTSIGGWIGLNLIVGMGTGMLFGATGFAVQASVSVDSISVAVCMFSFFRSLGSTIGIAIGGAAFQAQMHQQLDQYQNLRSDGSDFIKDSIALVPEINAIPDEGFRSIIVQAYARSLQNIWLDMCIVSGVGLLLTVFIQHYTLDVPLQGEAKSKQRDERSGSITD